MHSDCLHPSSLSSATVRRRRVASRVALGHKGCTSSERPSPPPVLDSTLRARQIVLSLAGPFFCHCFASSSSYYYYGCCCCCCCNLGVVPVAGRELPRLEPAKRHNNVTTIRCKCEHKMMSERSSTPLDL